ncbi:UDP-3-O-(3-hydroxymyristoyl)glucosamine N-acyltransferase [Halanaerobacter jeridensis]|uniref:UDP-3-O-acylglucosamine N-acyltransferase n=1 Tax=Halanaerobacter jeridensis TaxID=706427 RepID=A0A939BR40_9FIRM|nr:UDP-3-O-(3-hydroxymyristoyl)glucosamine N-acyltransferase [Halanaerobacter jeridensis]MBM7556989.1 UDP-3-O-[3-hydroxymyristoyl] glucosamine N-acyltransferase [Halanaerobacter jeridensis]
MKYNLKKLAELVDGQLQGTNIEIDGVGGADNAAKTEISFAQNQEYLDLALANAGAVLITEDLAADEIETPVIIVENPRLAFSKIAHKFTTQPYQSFNIADEAVISDTAQLGSEVSIHPGVVIADGAQIGDEVILAPGVYVGQDVSIGEGTILYPNVTVERGSQIGSDVEINSGAVIGSEGFGFEEEEEGYVKVPQFGNVVIEDDVEIGANVTIDRGATGSTTIGRSTKIDNLVHIAHNVEIGPECLIIAQVGIAGSAKVERKVTLAGKSGVVGHITIGENTTVAANSTVTHDLEAESFVSGYPAHDHRQERRTKAARKKLPEMLKRIRKLEKRIEELEE